MTRREIEVLPGSEIGEAIAEAKAAGGGWFDFNGVEVHVEPDSDVGPILRDYFRALYRKIEGPVGPYPAAELSQEEIDRDAEIDRQHEEKRRQQAEKMERDRRAKLAAVRAEIGGESVLVRDRVEWDLVIERNSHDGYSNATMDYAVRWAQLMQVRMRSAPLEEIAEQASYDADTDGITVFMYGCAVGFLAREWKHGEQLRRWHNLKHQIRDEGEKANESGGVLNPAIINVGDVTE